jgi:hypothetical protein
MRNAYISRTAFAGIFDSYVPNPAKISHDLFSIVSRAIVNDYDFIWLMRLIGDSTKGGSN